MLESLVHGEQAPDTSRVEGAAERTDEADETPSPRLRLGVPALRRAPGLSPLIRVLGGQERPCPRLGRRRMRDERDDWRHDGT